MWVSDNPWNGNLKSPVEITLIPPEAVTDFPQGNVALVTWLKCLAPLDTAVDRQDRLVTNRGSDIRVPWGVGLPDRNGLPQWPPPTSGTDGINFLPTPPAPPRLVVGTVGRLREK